MEIFVNKVKVVTRKPTNIKFTLVGDLHGIYRTKNFNKIVNAINDQKTDFLLVAGDICQGKTWQDPDNLIILNNVFSALAEAKPVFLIVGNHDLSKFNDVAYANYRSLSSIPNVFPLYNDNYDLSIGDEKAHISGLVTPLADYVTAGGNLKTKLHHREKEREFEIADYVRKLKEKDPLTDDKFNILLSHDPRQTRMDEVYKQEQDYDLITGAHIHNGYMPNAITAKSDILKDKDWLGVPTAGLVKNRNYTRGVIYGTNAFHVQKMPTGEWYLVENEKYLPITEEEANDIILNNENMQKNVLYTPTVITGGLNKYNVLPIDSAEITNVESTNTRKK